VGVRIAAPHHGSLVLEHLDVVDVASGSEPDHFPGPGIDHLPDRAGVHLREGEVVPRGETEDAAHARGGLGREESILAAGFRGVFRKQGREVVVEGEGRLVPGIARPVRPPVSGAEVTRGVVGGPHFFGDGFHLALPGPLQTVGRAHDPLVEERVVSPVGAVEKIHSGLALSLISASSAELWHEATWDGVPVNLNLRAHLRHAAHSTRVRGGASGGDPAGEFPPAKVLLWSIRRPLRRSSMVLVGAKMRLACSDRLVRPSIVGRPRPDDCTATGNEPSCRTPLPRCHPPRRADS
jgi:hypothetical protein